MKCILLELKMNRIKIIMPIKLTKLIFNKMEMNKNKLKKCLLQKLIIKLLKSK